MAATERRLFQRNSLIFKLFMFRAVIQVHHMYSINCTIIRYNNIQTCDNPATCFGHPGFGTRENTIMAIYVL
jgi:hypothetical protein